MEVSKTLNLFYSEPDPDRWFKYDRYLRRVVRRLVRGKQRPGGVAMVAIDLMKGLDKLNIPYRLNDYQYIKQHPNEVAGIIGKPHVLFERKWDNPILFGAGIYSHPIECPDLFEKYPNVKKVLVPGKWIHAMFEPYYGNKVQAWPVGIDTDAWAPTQGDKEFDFLIYDKIRWEHDQYQNELITPITQILDKHHLSYHFINYGGYNKLEFKEKINRSKAVIFLCEHETQGLAYQQILATNTPILAWDRGGYWQDPYYYPHKVKYKPVSSVPYWDCRCGEKFTVVNNFESSLTTFKHRLENLHYSPRAYILDNLTLEKCAAQYAEIYNTLPI